MPTVYLRSTDGTDGSSGLDWTNAKATLAGAFAAMTPGDTCYVSQAHAETQGTPMTLTAPGTAAQPCKVLCVQDSAIPPTTPATGATITTTSASAITLSGYAVYERLTFNVGSGSATSNFAANVAPLGLTFEQCAINLLTTGTASTIGILSPSATVAQYARFHACTFAFGNVNQNVVTGRGPVEIFGGSMAATGAVPTELFTPNINMGGLVHVMGADLGAVGTGKALVGVNVGGPLAIYRFMECKLSAGVTLTSGTHPGPGGPEVWLLNCDAGDVNYRMEFSGWEGTLATHPTIGRIGGATDGTLNPYALLMTASANVSRAHPLYTPWLHAPWIATVGAARTATVEILHNAATPLTDGEVWLELVHLGTPGVPLGVPVHDRVAGWLTTPVAQTASSVTWNTGGMGTPNKQKVHVAFTPQEEGPVIGRVALAKPSYALYIDPLLGVT
jgi:hypothetical protein